MLDKATGYIRTGSSRTLALPGLLIARTGRLQDRATIAGQFWPESDDGQALTNLRRELHDLRPILSEDALEITLGQLGWHDRGRHDIDLSTHAQQAVRDGGKGRPANWKAGTPGQPSATWLLASNEPAAANCSNKSATWRWWM